MNIKDVFCSLLFLLLSAPIIYFTACCTITFYFKAYKAYILSSSRDENKKQNERSDIYGKEDDL